jgi:uncharacterized protein with PIN domain
MINIVDLYKQLDLKTGQCPACANCDVVLHILSSCNICNEEIILWSKEMTEQVSVDNRYMLDMLDCNECGQTKDICSHVAKEFNRLKRLDEKANKFSQDELTMINTMLDVYYSGLNTGLIRSKSDEARKTYQELILKLRRSLRK